MFTAVFCCLLFKGEAMGIAFPIIITVYPRNDGVLSRRLAAAIRIPSTYQQSPPTPTDGAISIEERPGMTVYTLYAPFCLLFHDKQVASKIIKTKFTYLEPEKTFLARIFSFCHRSRGWKKKLLGKWTF